MKICDSFSCNAEETTLLLLVLYIAELDVIAAATGIACFKCYEPYTITGSVQLLDLLPHYILMCLPSKFYDRVMKDIPFIYLE